MKLFLNTVLYVNWPVYCDKASDIRLALSYTHKRHSLLPARRYASAGTIAMALCPSVSVTSRCSVEMAERIGLVLGVGASFDLSYTEF